MYTVSILSQLTRQWRSIQVSSLSQAVQLTLGLSTDWTITTVWIEDWFVTEHVVAVADDSLGRYNHALRALVQRWKAKHFDPVACFRMSDAQLLVWHKHLAYHL